MNNKPTHALAFDMTARTGLERRWLAGVGHGWLVVGCEICLGVADGGRGGGLHDGAAVAGLAYFLTCMLIIILCFWGFGVFEVLVLGCGG